MISYIAKAAAEIRANVDPAVELTDSSAPLFLLYAVLMRAKGTDVTASDVHDAWSAWRELTATDSPLIVPFGELDEATQSWDDPFVRAIQAAAASDPGS
jgi:hypothetical protein